MISLTKEDVVCHLGPICDHTVIEVLRVNPTIEDIESIVMRLAQEDDVMGAARKPLSGDAARIYDIVMRDPLYAEDEREDR